MKRKLLAMLPALIMVLALLPAVADSNISYVQLFLEDVKDWSLGAGDNQYMPMEQFYALDYDCSDITEQLSAEGIYVISVSNSDTNIKSLTYTVVLESDSTIRVIMKPISGFTGDLYVNEDSENYTVPLQSKRWTVEINNIPAHQLGDSHLVRARTDNSGGSTWDAGMDIANLSVMSYVLQLLNSNSEAAQNAGAALYTCWQAAKAYKEAH